MEGAVAAADDADSGTRCGGSGCCDSCADDNTGWGDSAVTDVGCGDSAVTDVGSGCGDIGATEGRDNGCGDNGVIDGKDSGCGDVGATAIGSACPLTTGGGGGSGDAPHEPAGELVATMTSDGGGECDAVRGRERLLVATVCGAVITTVAPVGGRLFKEAPRGIAPGEGARPPR